jgi:hypothetical protein
MEIGQAFPLQLLFVAFLTVPGSGVQAKNKNFK